MSVQFFRQHWIRYFALALVAMMLLPFVPFQPAVNIIVVFAGICIVTGSVLAIKLKLETRRDPYSLETLREYIEEGRIDHDEVPEVEEGVDRLCMYCNQFYGPQFPVCPKCGR